MVRQVYFDTTDEIFDQFENYEVSPCLIVGFSKSGEIIYEACDSDNPEVAIWSVYGHFLLGGRECISDHDILEEANEFERSLPVLKSQRRGTMPSNKWTREELIIAFNLYCKIPFGTIHIHNPQTIDLAKILGRTPSAVSWKLANLASLDHL